MKKVLITLVIASLLALSIVYSVNPFVNAGPKIINANVRYGQFDFSEANPTASEVNAYEIQFNNVEVMLGETQITSIYLSDKGAFSKEIGGNIKEIEPSLLDPENSVLVEFSDLEFFIYTSSNGDTNGYIFSDASIKNNIFKEDNAYAALLLYTTGPPAYAFATEEFISDKIGLSGNELVEISFKSGNKKARPKDQVQSKFNSFVLETPAAGCFDGDSYTEKYDEVGSYAYDNEYNFINDFCASDKGKQVLHEAYCNDENKVDIKEIECDGSCKNGACKEAEPTEDEKFCVDTDTREETGQLNTVAKLASALETKGAVVGFYSSRDNKYSLWEDYCISEGKLVEYSCKNNKGVFNVVYCPCEGGQCISKPYCLDSDGGENGNVKGKVYGADISNSYFEYFDECTADNKNVNEFFCDESGYNQKEIECLAGCSEGRCLKKDEVPSERKIIEETPALPPFEEKIVEEEINCIEGDEESYIRALKAQLKLLEEYEKIIAQAESKQKLPIKEEPKAAEQNAQPQSKFSLGQNCKSNMECASSYCGNINPKTRIGVCATKPKINNQLAQLKANGASCTSDSQCTSNRCWYLDPAVPAKTCMAQVNQALPVPKKIELPKVSLF